MSEALEIVDNLLNNFGEDNVQIETMTLSKCDILTIKQALQSLQSIDNSKPSEAVESLKLLGNFEWHNKLFKEAYSGLFDNIQQSLLKLNFLEDAMDLDTNCFSNFTNRNGYEVTIMRKERYEEYQEQDRVLEIIKEKEVNLGMLKTCKTVEQYNAGCRIFGRNELTQEEFELLKRYTNGK